MLQSTNPTTRHWRIGLEAGAGLVPVVLGLRTTTVTLIVFATTTLGGKASTAVAPLVIIGVSIGLNLWWSAARGLRVPEGLSGSSTEGPSEG